VEVGFYLLHFQKIPRSISLVVQSIEVLKSAKTRLTKWDGVYLALVLFL